MNNMYRSEHGHTFAHSYIKNGGCVLAGLVHRRLIPFPTFVLFLEGVSLFFGGPYKERLCRFSEMLVTCKIKGLVHMSQLTAQNFKVGSI